MHRVQIVCRELDIEKDIEWIPTQPYESPQHLLEQNPLSKVPTLVTDTGLSLFPGHLIYEYLDSMAGPKLYPTTASDRWTALRLLSLGEGLWDTTVIWNNERKRTNEKASESHLYRYMAAILRILELLEKEAHTFNTFNIGHISIAGTLGFLEFAHQRDVDTNPFGSTIPNIRQNRPNLCHWYDKIRQRPSFRES